MDNKINIEVVLVPIKLAFLVLISYSLFYYFSSVFINEEVDHGMSFHSLPTESMDVIVIGSSHAQYSFNPGFFYQDTGLYSYVLGSPCQPFEVSYEMLKEALKAQKPSTVIFEVYTSMPLRSVCEGDSSYVMAQYLMRGEEKINTINYLPEEKAITYYNDFYNFHNDWRYVKSINDLKPSDSVKISENKISSDFGYVYLPQTMLNNYWPAAIFESSVDVELDKKDLDALNSIYNLCKENKIELILYKTPVDNMTIENQSYLYEVWKWADNNEVTYIDFIQETKRLDYMMWIQSDSYHAYINGAEIITSELAGVVTKSNKANHEEIASLTDKYYESGQGYLMRYAEFEKDPYKYLDRLAKFEQPIIVTFLGSDTLPSDWLYEKMHAIGIELPRETNSNLFILVDNNEIVSSNKDGINTEFEGSEIIANEKGVYINGEAIPTDGPLSIVLCNDLFDKYIVRNLEYRGYTWEYGYDYYTKLDK